MHQINRFSYILGFKSYDIRGISGQLWACNRHGSQMQCRQPSVRRNHQKHNVQEPLRAIDIVRRLTAQTRREGSKKRARPARPP